MEPKYSGIWWKQMDIQWNSLDMGPKYSGFWWLYDEFQWNLVDMRPEYSRSQWKQTGFHWIPLDVRPKYTGFWWTWHLSTLDLEGKILVSSRFSWIWDPHTVDFNENMMDATGNETQVHWISTDIWQYPVYVAGCETCIRWIPMEISQGVQNLSKTFIERGTIVSVEVHRKTPKAGGYQVASRRCTVC